MSDVLLVPGQRDPPKVDEQTPVSGPQPPPQVESRPLDVPAAPAADFVGKTRVQALPPIALRTVGDKSPRPITLVILGAGGDLTTRKLIPALQRLVADGLIHPDTQIVGASRDNSGDEVFRAKVAKSIESFGMKAEVDPGFLERFHFQPTQFGSKADFVALRERLEKLTKEEGAPEERVYYFAAPPATFEDIVENLDQAKLVDREKKIGRLIVEKPFGVDQKSAQHLEQHLAKVANPDQIFRLDHYNGKEGVERIAALRFLDRRLEPFWNSSWVSKVELEHGESIGIEGRGTYFDPSGMVRDMIQSHLLQVMAMLGMEPPSKLDAEQLRSSKLGFLKHLGRLSPAEVERQTVRGQYLAGVIDGRPLPDYHQERGVDPNSTTETYAAIQFKVKNRRWNNTPFVIKSGKALATAGVSLKVTFRTLPSEVLPAALRGKEGSGGPVTLTIGIQPRVALTMSLADGRSAPLELPPGRAWELPAKGDYDRVLARAIAGDDLFSVSARQIDALWAWVDPILNAWKNQSPPKIERYVAGSNGPAGAALL